MISFVLPVFKRALTRFKRDEGNATIEFAIFFPLLVTLLLSTVEIGILSIRQVMLEQAVDLTVRDLRLGKIESPDQDKLRNLICARSLVVADCSGSLLVELRPVSTVTWAPLSEDTTCKDRSVEIDPENIVVAPGQSNDMVLIRVCAIFIPVFPTTTFGIHLSRDEYGGYALVTSSAFVNEPA